jgi:aspartate/methionine/tyrosine aminotransferase
MIRYGDEPHASVLEFDGMADRTILLDGWSKTFAMTGWRLGYGVFPPALVEPVTRLAINSVSCTSAFSQYAAIAALEGPWEPVTEMVAEFRRRRDVIVAGLNDIPGISCAEPQGAFYAFPNITATGLTGAELQDRLLYQAGVAALSGTAFGAAGEGYLRFSYANSIPNIKSALTAIRGALQLSQALTYRATNWGGFRPSSSHDRGQALPGWPAAARRLGGLLAAGTGPTVAWAAGCRRCGRSPG